MGIKRAKYHLFCLHTEFSCINAKTVPLTLALWLSYSMGKIMLHTRTSEWRNTSSVREGKISFLDIYKHSTWLTLSSLCSQLRGKGIAGCDSLATLNIDLTVSGSLWKCLFDSGDYSGSSDD